MKLRRLRFIGEAPLASFWGGLGVFFGYLIVWLLIQNLLGMLDGFRLARSLPIHGVETGRFFWASPFGWFEMLNAALIAYLFGALLHGRRGALRDLDALRPILPWSDAEFASQRERLFVYAPGRTVGVVILGAGSGVAISFFDSGVWGGHGRPPLSEPYFAFVSLRMALVGLLFALLGRSEFLLALRFFRLGRDEVEVDLSNLRPLVPFARKGQRSVVIWMLALAIFSLFFLSPAIAWTNFGTVSFGVVIAGVAFLLPVIGVHQNIVAAKDRELDHLSREIGRERDRLLLPSGAVPEAAENPASGQLADLIAYKGMIEATREWPFGASTVIRVLFFMALGIGSWVGAAIVERLLGAALE